MTQAVTLLGEGSSGWLSKLKTVLTTPPTDPWATPSTPAPPTPAAVPTVETVAPVISTAVTVPASGRSTLLRNTVVGGVLVLGGYVVYTLLSPKKKAPNSAPVAGLFHRRRRR